MVSIMRFHLLYLCLFSHCSLPSPFSLLPSVPSLQFNPNPSDVLGVFGLSLYTSEKDLKEIFSRYGELKHVNIVYDHLVRFFCTETCTTTLPPFARVADSFLAGTCTLWSVSFDNSPHVQQRVCNCVLSLLLPFRFMCSLSSPIIL